MMINQINKPVMKMMEKWRGKLKPEDIIHYWALVAELKINNFCGIWPKYGDNFNIRFTGKQYEIRIHRLHCTLIYC